MDVLDRDSVIGLLGAALVALGLAGLHRHRIKDGLALAAAGALALTGLALAAALVIGAALIFAAAVVWAWGVLFG